MIKYGGVMEERMDKCCSLRPAYIPGVVRADLGLELCDIVIWFETTEKESEHKLG